MPVELARPSRGPAACPRRRSSSRRARSSWRPARSREIDELAVEAVAGGEPLVLVEHLPRVVAAARPPAVEVLAQLLTIAWISAARPSVCSTRVWESHDPDLDRPEARVRAHVVPEVRVVLHDAAGDHELDLRARSPPSRGRSGGIPTRGNARKIGVRVDTRPGRVGAPERRVGAQREQHGQVDAHPVGDVDGLVGVVDADVDVHPEDELLARDEAQRGDRGRGSAGAPTIRWSSHIANGWVPAEPIVRPLRAALLAHLAAQRPQLRRPPRRCSRTASVEISSTDSMSSGLISPSGASSSSASIALTRS